MNAQLEEQGCTVDSDSLADTDITDTETTETEAIVQYFLQQAGLTDSYKANYQALSALLKYYLLHAPEHEFDPFICSVLIAQLERKITQQVDAVLHHPEFQALESGWRSIKLLVKQTPFNQNIKIEILNISLDDLREELDDAPETVKSGLYKLVYSREYGQFGGEPYGVILGNYYITPKGSDVRLMSKVASIAAMAHTPFIAAADADFFELDNMRDLASIVDIEDIHNTPRFAKWKRLRSTEDARYIGLVLPRFLLRTAYLANAEKLLCYGIEYQEQSSHNSELNLWGNSAFLFVTRLIDSFARYRWCPHIIGPAGGGQVEDMLTASYPALGNRECSLPTEVMITDRREFELTESGFIALTLRRGESSAAFYSANSIQSNKHFGFSAQEQEKQTNFKLGGQLTYLFVINRIAHYLKVIQRENIGTWKEKADVERGLNLWLKQYVSDQENPSMEIRNRRPLRKAQVEVQPVEGEPGWYRAMVQVRPHFKYMGADFTLSLVGKLEVSNDVQQHRQQI